MKDPVRIVIDAMGGDNAPASNIEGAVASLNEKTGFDIIFTGDKEALEAELRAMRLEANRITYEDEEGWFMDYPSDEEAYQRFADQGVLSPAQIREALDNTGVFLTFEDVDLDKGKKLPTL